MSTHQEFLAEWPDGTPVWEEMKSSPAFFHRFDKLCHHLKGLSVPKAYWPTVYVRTVETTVKATGWVTWGEHQRQEHQRNNTTLTPEVSIPTTQDGPRGWGTITPAQIERVRGKQHSLSDPCVICGLLFQNCHHTMAETELFISYIKNNYGHVLRQKP